MLNKANMTRELCTHPKSIWSANISHDKLFWLKFAFCIRIYRELTGLSIAIDFDIQLNLAPILLMLIRNINRFSISIETSIGRCLKSSENIEEPIRNSFLFPKQFKKQINFWNCFGNMDTRFEI